MHRVNAQIAVAGLALLVTTGCGLSGTFYKEMPLVGIIDPASTVATTASTYEVSVRGKWGPFTECTLERVARENVHREAKAFESYRYEPIVTFTVPLLLLDQYSTSNHLYVECSGPNGSASDTGLIIRTIPQPSGE